MPNMNLFTWMLDPQLFQKKELRKPEECCSMFEWVVATRTGMQALVGKDRNCGPELRGLHRLSGW